MKNDAKKRFWRRMVYAALFLLFLLFLFVSAQVRYSQLFFLKIANYRSNHTTLSTNPWLFYRSSTS